MDAQQLLNMLLRHDWSFQYSDDPNVWSRGYKALSELQGAMKVADAMDSSVAAFNFWNREIEPIKEQIVKSFGGGFGFYDWLREYLPEGHEWHKGK